MTIEIHKILFDFFVSIFFLKSNKIFLIILLYINMLFYGNFYFNIFFFPINVIVLYFILKFITITLTSSIMLFLKLYYKVMNIIESILLEEDLLFYFYIFYIIITISILTHLIFLYILIGHFLVYTLFLERYFKDSFNLLIDIWLLCIWLYYLGWISFFFLFNVHLLSSFQEYYNKHKNKKKYINVNIFFFILSKFIKKILYN